MFFWKELSCFFDDPADVGNLISGSSAFSKTSLNIRKFTVHVLLKPGLEYFKHYFTGMWDKYNCAIVWAFFGIAFLWNWNENWPFPVQFMESQWVGHDLVTEQQLCSCTTWRLVVILRLPLSADLVLILVLSPQLLKWTSNCPSHLPLTSLQPFLYTQPEGVSFLKHYRVAQR